MRCGPVAVAAYAFGLPASSARERRASRRSSAVASPSAALVAGEAGEAVAGAVSGLFEPPHPVRRTTATSAADAVARGELTG